MFLGLFDFYEVLSMLLLNPFWYKFSTELFIIEDMDSTKRKFELKYDSILVCSCLYPILILALSYFPQQFPPPTAELHFAKGALSEGAS